MKCSMYAVLSRSAGLLGVFAALAAPQAVDAQTAEEARLVDAAAILLAFTANDEEAIPAELLARARGIAVIPNVFRGGLIFGARRGRGVVAIKSERGEWSNPAFITLTGGSFGWQAGAESTELVLIFANDNAIKNMRSGKFTLGGDASAVAGPVGRRAAAAVTFRAEVYGYVRSRGLFAGAAFEGARLAIDKDTNARFYGRGGAEQALAPRSTATPASARRFLQTLEQVAAGITSPAASAPAPEEKAVTFPLE
jgi:lipid-binding SYLF domain-containing protein